MVGSFFVNLCVITLLPWRGSDHGCGLYRSLSPEQFSKNDQNEMCSLTYSKDLEFI